MEVHDPLRNRPVRLIDNRTRTVVNVVVDGKAIAALVAGLREKGGMA